MIKIIKYDTDRFNFRSYIENCLGKLEDIHKNFDLKPCALNTKGGVDDRMLACIDPDENTFYGLIEKVFKEVIHSQYAFRYMWWRFQKEVLKPLFNEDRIVAQKLPSIKIFPSGYEWNYVENPIEKDGRKINRHLDSDPPYYHPEFETTFILPLIDMDEDNGLFFDDKMRLINYGEFISFTSEHYHGGYVINNSKNTRVSMDFKAVPFSKYDVSTLSDKLIKKRGKLVKQNEIYTIGKYYSII